MSVASLLTLLCISLWNVDTCMAKRSAQQARFFADAQRSSNGIVELKSSKEFEEAIASPRDFSLALLLTAVDSAPINCVPCKAFQPNFEGVARGFKKVKASDLHDRHLFAYVEFKNGREIFQKVRIHISSGSVADKDVCPAPTLVRPNSPLLSPHDRTSCCTLS